MSNKTSETMTKQEKYRWIVIYTNNYRRKEKIRKENMTPRDRHQKCLYGTGKK